MDNELLSSIEGKKREIDKYRPFNATILHKLNEQFTLEWTYNSNAIEGNTLTLQETEIVLNRGLTIGGKTVNEHLEALNHKESIDFIHKFIEKKELITEETIKRLHEVVLKGIDDSEAGKYRTQNVRILGSIHIPPQSIKIPHLMEEFIQWYYQNEYSLPHPVMSAKLHYQLVSIHPFIDGNGRVSRLFMNLFLMKNGYPPAVILNVDRKKYYRVLNQADKGNEELFEDFIGRSIERSLIIYLQSIKPNIPEKQGLIPLKDATKYCSYSQEYLSLLARKGKLSSIKLNKEWFTSQEAIEEYIELHATKEKK